MKIGIIGTRGIPNQYGGFEQFTEFIAPALVERGHEVLVYNSSLHPYKESSWKAVRLIHCYDPEDRLGTAGQFIYDFNCIRNSRRWGLDIILQLGYTSSSIWSFLFPKNSLLVTNMDGLEWKRTKYSMPVRYFLKNAEKWAARYSDLLIADSIGIQDYLQRSYQKSSRFIPYGAVLFDKPDETRVTDLGLEPFGYNLMIARMEPENNIETVMLGYADARSPKPLILIGNYGNRFGQYLRNKFASDRIRFWGPQYDIALLNQLRHFSNIYFHGHSVGGTNPSLLEAMASQCLIVAHDNVFNHAVLGAEGMYFSYPADISSLLHADIEKSTFQHFIALNNQKVRELYAWDHITDLLENFLLEALQSAGRQSRS